MQVIEFIGPPAVGKSTIAGALANAHPEYRDVSRLLSLPQARRGMNTKYISELRNWFAGRVQPTRVEGADIRFAQAMPEVVKSVLDLLTVSTDSAPERLRRLRKSAYYLSILQAVQEHSGAYTASGVVLSEGLMKVLGPAVSQVSVQWNDWRALSYGVDTYVLIDADINTVYDRYKARKEILDLHQHVGPEELRKQLYRSVEMWRDVAQILRRAGCNVIHVNTEDAVSENVSMLYKVLSRESQGAR